MSISNAQFAQWLLSDAPRVLLAEVEFAYESAGAVATGTIYLASRAYITGPADTPPNRAYRDAIRSMPRFTRALDLATLGGRAVMSVDDLALDNVDGAMDFLLDAIVDGREIAFYLGAPQGTPGWTRADFRQVLVGIVENVTAPSESRITLQIGDRRLSLDTDIVGETISSGVASGQPKPLVFGHARNMMGQVKGATADLQFWLAGNYASGAYIYEGRDSGVSLGVENLHASVDNTALTANAGTDTMNYVAHGLAEHDVIRFVGSAIFAGLTVAASLRTGQQYWVIAAGLTVDDFRVSLTKGGTAVDITGTTFAGSVSIARARFWDNVEVDGSVALSTSPAGRVTWDVCNPVVATTTPPNILRHLALTYGNVASGDVDSGGFGARNVTNGYLQVDLVVMERQNLMDVMDAVARSAFMWYGADYGGVIRGGSINPYGIAAATADYTIGQDEIIGEIAVENRPVRYGAAVYLSDRQWVTQTDGLATSLHPITVARLGRTHATRDEANPSGTDYSANPEAYHKTAVVSKPLETVLGEEFEGPKLASGYFHAVAMREDGAAWHRVVRLTTTIEKYDWDLGDVVEFTYPRYGLDAGVNFRIVAIDADLIEDRVTLTLLTRAEPDYTTASYP